MWRSVTDYHPEIGYTFVPGVKARVPHVGGGYLVRANGSGFRCEHEFVAAKTPGTFRILLFGDSQTAGDGVANADRYGDRLERAVAGIEVYNFGLPGTGTDQQYLAYRSFAPDLEYDLIVLGLYVENIGRVASRFRPYVDENGDLRVYAKPYYSLEDGHLTLHNVPVPKQALRPADLTPEEGAQVDWGVPFHSIRKILRTLGLRDLMQRVTHYNLFPTMGRQTIRDGSSSRR